MGTPAPSPWIALVGMMGAGKSTVGQALAHRLGLSFVDLDHRIEVRAGMSIPAIFEAHGPTVFREQEHAALGEVLAQTPPGVVATGGGVLTYEKSAKALAQGAYTVYLEVQLPELLRRLSSPKARAARPLLPECQDALGERLQVLFQARASSYQASDLTVDAQADVSVVVQRIASTLDWGSRSEGPLS